MTRRVAVLGGGIMGICTALFLARGGAKVTVIEAAPSVMQGASRWNEGKIHLGYLYAGDGSGRSIAAMIPGGLAFRGLVESLIDGSLDGHVTAGTDHYLRHHDSVVGPADYAAHVAAVDRALAEAAEARALPRPAPARQLDAAKLADLGGEAADMGFAVPEYSVDTQWLADRLAGALHACPGVEVITGQPAAGITPRPQPGAARTQGPYRVLTAEGARIGPFDAVVGALWQNRLALDRALGLPTEASWQHRYRKSLFFQTDRPFAQPSRVFAVGPFGDIKNYGGQRFYASWYPAGLLAVGEEATPPIPRSDRPDAEILARTTAALTRLAPDMAPVFAAARDMRVEGGWVFARGTGRLDDPRASLHQRHAHGVARFGGYYSVDTGKYSTAPLMAQALARDILA